MQTNVHRQLLLRTAEHGKREYASILLWLLLTAGLPLMLVVWLSSVIAFAASFVTLLSTVSQDWTLVSWPVTILILFTAMVVFTFSSISRELPSTASWIGNQFEDTVGRGVVFFHALGHTLISDKWASLRKIAGVALTFVALWVTVWCFRWSLESERLIARDQTGAQAVVSLAALIFVAKSVLTATLALLIVRFGFSKKWSAIYAKPKCLHGMTNNGDFNAAAREVRIVHASDLHVTDTDETPLTEGSKKLQAATIASVLNGIAADAEDCAAVLLTGDITDNGSALAWTRFLDSVPDTIRGKLVVLPGNHDLNLQDPRLFIRAERSDRLGRRMRQIRMLCAMTELMGNRAYVMDRQTGRRMTLSDYFDRNLSSLEIQVAGTGISRKTVAEIWSSLFPMVVVVNDARLGIVLFDSTKPGSLGATNAFGQVPSECLETCSALMTSMSDKCDSFAFALHHHIAIPRDGQLKNRMQDAGLICENAAQLMDFLAKRGDPTVVFHGHRHIKYDGLVENSDVSIVASPSATIGAKGEGDGSWRVVTLSTSSNACRLVGIPADKRLHQSTAAAIPPVSQIQTTV